jgi:hypothetical protein
VDQGGTASEAGGGDGQNLTVLVNPRDARAGSDAQAPRGERSGARAQIDQPSGVPVERAGRGVEDLLVVRDEGPDLAVVVPQGDAEM